MTRREWLAAAAASAAGAAPTRPSIVFILADDMGYADLSCYGSTWSKTHYCYLEDLFVAPNLRAGGIGRALIEAVYREADARGCSRTYWMTQEFNYRARGLYDQMATKTPFVQYRR